jgi:hypothetical protein
MRLRNGSSGGISPGRSPNQDVDKFQQWGTDRSRLDEVWKPKEETCLKGQHNEDLGKHVAVWNVVQAGCSMTWFVWSLHGCPDLHDALALPDSSS